jgi:hypothetical protein
VNDWDRAYLNLAREANKPEPAERRRADVALYIVAAIALVVLAAVI